MDTLYTKNGCQVSLVTGCRSNVYLLRKGDLNILIDAGVCWQAGHILKKLRQLRAAHIDYLIITHAHYDHVGCAAQIRKKFNARLLAHHWEAGPLISGKAVLPEGSTFITRPLMDLLGGKVAPLFNHAPCPCDYLWDGWPVAGLLDMPVNIISTPGHSKGSISLIVDDELALVGDTLLGWLKKSVFPPFADDVKQMLDSWGLLLETSCRLFLPAHGRPISRARLQNNYAEKRAALCS